MHFLDQFYEDSETYNLNFGTDIELPSGRKLHTGSFDSVNIVNVPANAPLPVTVKIKNNKVVHISHHRCMEDAELSIVALAYFCDSAHYMQALEQQVRDEEAQEAAAEDDDENLFNFEQPT